MNLIKNIKKNYYNKLFDEHLKAENYKQLVSDLKALSYKDIKLFSNIAIRYIVEIYNNYNTDDLLNKNLIWLNSFHKDDTKIIKNFLEFYLPTTFNHEFEFLDFSQELSGFFQILNESEKYISFDKVLDVNEIVQFLISQKNKKFKFVINNGAFFEILETKKYFTYTNISCSYVYMIRNPISIYQDLCNQNVSKEESLNRVLYLDGRNQIFDNGHHRIEENNQSWETNVNSWTNENVLNTFNGLLIKYENLNDDSIQIFAELIAHLNMSGLNIELDYEKIQEFVSTQQEKSQSITNSPSQISNNIKKLFSRQYGTTAKKFLYEF